MELSYGRAARCHTFLYAPEYEGWVTLGIRPLSRTVDKDLRLYIQWEWKLRPTLIREIPREGVVLCTGKGMNSEHEIMVLSSEPIFMGFGYGGDGFPRSQNLYTITDVWGKDTKHEKRVREGGDFWVEPKDGPLDPDVDPLKTPRTR
jgi:hypothetical protein